MKRVNASSLRLALYLFYLLDVQVSIESQSQQAIQSPVILSLAILMCLLVDLQRTS